MNTYVSKMKDVLSGFYPQMKRKREEKAEAKERYSADVAAQEIDRIDREATALRNATMDKLQQLHDEGVAQAQRWGNLDGSMITDDIKLLKGGFDLNRQQVESLVERYRSNGTMMTAIDSYAGSHGMVGMNIPTVDKKVNFLSPIGLHLVRKFIHAQSCHHHASQKRSIIRRTFTITNNSFFATQMK